MLSKEVAVEFSEQFRKSVVAELFRLGHRQHFNEKARKLHDVIVRAPGMAVARADGKSEAPIVSAAASRSRTAWTIWSRPRGMFDRFPSRLEVIAARQVPRLRLQRFRPPHRPPRNDRLPRPECQTAPGIRSATVLLIGRRRQACHPCPATCGRAVRSSSRRKPSSDRGVRQSRTSPSLPCAKHSALASLKAVSTSG